MLDTSFFKNPRFTAASLGIMLLFFAMFGSIFLLTQYLQFVMGFTALKAGVALLPLAITMLVVAPSSARIVERLGTKLVVGSGLAIAGIGLALFATVPSENISYWGDIAWRMVIMAIGMGLTMAPATESIMGSLPSAKAGVGSAMNDTTRQIGGALRRRDHRQRHVVVVRLSRRHRVHGRGRHRPTGRSRQTRPRSGARGRGRSPNTGDGGEPARHRGEGRVRVRHAPRCARRRGRRVPRCVHRVPLAARSRGPNSELQNAPVPVPAAAGSNGARQSETVS